jgi:hypothetical protein
MKSPQAAITASTALSAVFRKLLRTGSSERPQKTALSPALPHRDHFVGCDRRDFAASRFSASSCEQTRCRHPASQGSLKARDALVAKNSPQFAPALLSAFRQEGTISIRDGFVLAVTQYFPRKKQLLREKELERSNGDA